MFLFTLYDVTRHALRVTTSTTHIAIEYRVQSIVPLHSHRTTPKW